jgi:hypothetical protein
MTRWEYQVIRQDTLKGFEEWLAMSGAEGWEAISASYAIHAPEHLESPIGDQETPRL